MTSTQEAHRYRLVQRLRSRAAPSGKGFDRYFSMDYMGSTEFEIGEQFQSLKRMRAAGDIVVVGCDVTHAGVTDRVFFVGPSVGLVRKIADFDEWMAGGCLGQESSYFPDRLSGRSDDWSDGIVAWWSLADDIGWALSADVANDLRLGFQGDSA